MSQPSGVWDTHVHLLDPRNYSNQRTYTPPAASADSLLSTVPANNFLLVQATIEQDETSLLQEAARLRSLHDARTFRVAVLHDITKDIAPERAQELQRMDVRCLRIHAGFSRPPDTLAAAVSHFLKGPVVAIARQYSWAISLNLPMEMWAHLSVTLREHHPGVPIIAEHCGGASWPLLEHEVPAFEAFLDILRSKAAYVKLGALHRRVRGDHAASELGGMIAQIAKAGPRQLLWGSDWPHVDAESKTLVEAPFLEVDESAELQLIRQHMTVDCFDAMLKETPNSLFA